jgi:hypothetical protein
VKWGGGLLPTIALCMSTVGVEAFYCSRPSEPYVRSGYSADYDQMERAKREVDDYLDEINEYLQCLANEHADAKNEAENILDEWNRAVRNFNNR